jgi:hypothetical protein
VAGGLGAIGLATGGIIGLKVSQQTSDAEKICKDTPTTCPDADIEQHGRLVDSAKSNRTRAYIAAGAGGALLITGVVLVLTAGSDSAPAAGLSLGTGPDMTGGWAVAASGRF